MYRGFGACNLPEDRTIDDPTVAQVCKAKSLARAPQTLGTPQGSGFTGVYGGLGGFRGVFGGA